MVGTQIQSSETSRLGLNAEKHLLRRYPSITLAMAAAAGIQGGLWSWRFPLLAVAAAAGLFWLARHTGVRRISWLAALCWAAAAFAVYSGQQNRRLQQASLAPYLAEQWQPAVMRMVVTSRIERRPNVLARLRGKDNAWQSIFDARVVALRIGPQWRAVRGDVRVNVDADATAFLPGDELQVLGKIQAIPPPRNPGEVDMRAIYASRGQQARVRVNRMDQLQRVESRFAMQRPFAAFGAFGERVLSRHLGESSGPLAAALVLGRREAVERAQRDRLLETGTAHLLSVSGLHLGMVALAASWILAVSSISQNKQYLAILFVCVVYAAVTGGRPPVMRAALLIVAILLGMWSGRMVHPLNALALAGLGLLLWDPANLTKVGVHLSFLAVATLIFASRGVSPIAAAGQAEDPLDRLVDARLGALRRFGRINGRRLAIAFRFSFWVWAVSAPLVWYHFHIVSPISIVANVLLGLPLMVALMSGLFTVAAGVVLDALAVLPAAICHASLSLMVAIIEALAAVPLGHFWLPAPPSWWVVLFYGLVAVGLALPRRWPRTTLLLVWLAVWSGLAFPLSTVYRRDYLHRVPADSLEATFIDVGHGTSVLVRQGDGSNWLYDCGRLGDPLESSRAIEAVLWDRGVVTIDAVVISHADSDHYNALPGLLRRFAVRRIITPPGMLATDEPGLTDVRDAIAQAQVEVVQYHSHPIVDRAAPKTVLLQIGGGASSIRVLHPPQQRLKGNDNVNSLVLQIEHGGRSLLLPGDLESPGTEALMRFPRPSGGGIMMAPHHGSMQQDMRPLLDWARPRTVVISGGARAGREEVLQTLGQNGADVFVTSLQGAITTRIAGDGSVTVHPLLPQPAAD